MSKLFLAAASIAMAASPAFSTTFGGTTGYGLAGGGTELVVFNDISAGSSSRTINLTGGVLDAITYRPVTGELYGYSTGGGSNTIYLIDAVSGALTSVGAAFASGAQIASGAMVGFDFNNVIDAARAVSTNADNLVYFPDGFPSANAGTVQRFTDLFYVAGDVNEGTGSEVFANAYTNAVNGQTSSATTQYVLDATTDSLAILGNNTGTLSTVGAITINGFAADLTSIGGFDIVSPMEGTDYATALLNLEGGGTSGLYSINLATGAATLIFDTNRNDFTGYAASIGNVSAVPLPASALLLLGGLGGLSILRRRKTA